MSVIPVSAVHRRHAVLSALVLLSCLVSATIAAAHGVATQDQAYIEQRSGIQSIG